MDPILKALKKNARETPETLAEALNISADEVRARIADYEARGVIQGYRAVIDEDLLDLDAVSAVIEVRIRPERAGGFDRIAYRVSRFPEVDSVFLMSGTYDLLVFVKSSNLKVAARFVNERLATIDGVLSTSTHFMLKTYKDQGVLMRLDETDERLSVTP